MGAVLAFTLASGVGVQAKDQKQLERITKVSEVQFASLKLDGEASLEQKHQVVGKILLQSGVPEFIVERLNDTTVETLYLSPGFEVKTGYFREESNGELKQISYEQHNQIRKYNKRLEIKRNAKLSSVALLGADDGVVVSDPVREIPNLVQILIVGGTLSNGQRLLSTVAGWEEAPTMRMEDFIGICSDKITTNDLTEEAYLEYTVTDYGGSSGTGSIEERSITYVPSTSKFVEGTQGTGKGINLPNDYIMPDFETGVGRKFCMSNIVLGIHVMSKPDTSVYKVIGQYFHKKLTLITSVGISSGGFSFSASPQFAYDDSTVSLPFGFD